MKIRFIALGKGKLDKRSFGFQYMANIGVCYVRFGLFGIMCSLHGYDPVADLQQMKTKLNAPPQLYFNRHQRRAMMSTARKHAKA